MSVSVRLGTDLLPVDAGVSTPLDIEIANQTDATDQYELTVEGLDPEWTAVPVPSFSVSSRDIQTQKVFFKPPRTSESLAGNYPFVVKVRSLESGETRVTQGVLQIKPYHHMSMEILPKKGTYSPVKRRNVFHATLVNLGNTEHMMQFMGSDPEDSLNYEFPGEQISVGPGQQKDVRIVVLPTERRPLSSSRLHGFQISARSMDTPSVSASAQAQLEQRPVVTAGGLFTFIMFLALFIGWYMFMPKPPVMETFMADQQLVHSGDKVTLSWSSANAKSVRILFNDKVIVSAGAPKSSTSINASISGTFKAVAVRDTRESVAMEFDLKVQEPVVVLPPVVESFDVRPREVAPGESLVCTYQLKNAETATLNPAGVKLDPTSESIKFTAPAQTGTVKYYIRADNSVKNVRSREITVTVAAKPKAAIVVFRADPMEVDPLLGKCTITWQISNAARAELIVDGQTTQLEDTSGEITLDVTKTTQITLVGYDSNGLTVKKSATIKLKATEPPPDDTLPGTTGDTGGGGQ